MSWIPGLITRIDGDRMDVKVPTAEDCPACPIKSVCTFEGPASAYRTLHVASRDGYRVGDRVEVEEPISVLGVTFVALVLVPVILLSIGHWLTTRFEDTLEMASFWGTSAATWLVVVYLANRWMTRSPRFATRIRRVARLQNSRQAGRQVRIDRIAAGEDGS